MIASDRMMHVMLAVTQNANDESSWRSWAAVASVIVALLALLVSASNRRIARRALSLSEEQERRRVARLDLSLREAVEWRRTPSSRLLGLDVLVVNPTDRDGTVIAAELQVTFSPAPGTNVLVKVPHRITDTLAPGVVPLEIPSRLPANGAVSGWLLFELKDALFEGGTIEHYEAVVQDSRGPIASVYPWVLGGPR